VERALAFVRRHVSASGVLGVADPDVLEYPNYATAYALRCLARAGAPGDRALIDTMRARLVSEQYTPARGFTEASLVFGGWGFGGARPPGQAGHMDIAHTRCVLQALRESGTQDRAVFTRALMFLRLMQRHPSERRPHPPPLVTTAGAPRRAVRFDGGFFFSPVVLDANKGAVLTDDRGAYHGSYATATGDGLLALLAAGLPAGDQRVRAARRWLEQHERLDQPEGVPAGGPQDWGHAIEYYHLAVRAEAYAALGISARLRPRLPLELRPRQRPDGSFVNERNHLMKEDDPLLATALAVIALR
jgi:squalene-hopene/tetraprenyl-beta-curcumene cyclase